MNETLTRAYNALCRKSRGMWDGISEPTTMTPAPYPPPLPYVYSSVVSSRRHTVFLDAEMELSQRPDAATAGIVYERNPTTGDWYWRVVNARELRHWVERR